ncbi:DUF2291 domain-containing protein [Novosphingobium sp. MW5]|nr:DUF2291 domain-containing protein [Novosphingobium sp. MW5]
MALFSSTTRIALCAAIVVAVNGCTVLSSEEDKAMREARSRDVDAGRYVEARWVSTVLPALDKRATNPADLATALSEGMDKAGDRFGRSAGEGSSWTFVVRGQVKVESVDRSSQRGTVTVSFDTPKGLRQAILQSGPYVSGTAIRDALDFIRFNDFKDQIVFAEVGNALTARALKESAALDSVQAGSRIELLGVVALREAGDAWVVTPVAVKPVP